MTRRTNVKFDPKQTIEILKLGEPSSELNDEQKLDLVKKYMDVSIIYNNFKKNVLKIISRHYQLTTISRDFLYLFDISSIGNMNIILSHPQLTLVFSAHPTLCRKSNYVHFYTMKKLPSCKIAVIFRTAKNGAVCQDS